jgi:hypothetical protein
MRSPSAPVIPLLFACLALSLPAAAAHAQAVRRCIGADGHAVYTDRKCEAIGAAERLPPATASDDRRLFRGGCPRVLSQLVNEIGAAIQGDDVNRLAGVYDWNGVSEASASKLMDRLEAIVARPLVDIAPVYPHSDPAYTPEAPALPPAAAPESAASDMPAPASGAAAWVPSWASRAQDRTGGADDEARWYPQEAAARATSQPVPPPSRPRPVALRIEQTLAGSATPARTVFALRRSYGCFWIAL